MSTVKFQHLHDICTFNDFVRSYPCDLCPLLSDARDLRLIYQFNDTEHYNEFPIPNDIFSNHRNVDVLFVGEAIGSCEAEAGLPFVGEAGRFIRGAMESVLEEMRVQVNYNFLNCVMCRPKNDSTPTVKSVKACRPFFLKQIELIGPKVIVALGKVAIAGILQCPRSKIKMKEMANQEQLVKIHDKEYPVLCMYHPRYLLYQEEGYNISEDLYLGYKTSLQLAINLAMGELDEELF